MAKVKLTVIKGNCRSGYHKRDDTFIVEDLCPAICHELWNCIYPSVFTLLNGGTLDCGNTKSRSFTSECPDGGRVIIKGELLAEKREDDQDK